MPLPLYSGVWESCRRLCSDTGAVPFRKGWAAGVVNPDRLWYNCRMENRFLPIDIQVSEKSRACGCPSADCSAVRFAAGGKGKFGWKCA